MTNQPVGQMSRRALLQAAAPASVGAGGAVVALSAGAKADPSHVQPNSVRAYLARYLEAEIALEQAAAAYRDDDARLETIADVHSGAIALVFQGRVLCKEDAIAALSFLIRDHDQFCFEATKYGQLLNELIRYVQSTAWV